MLQDVWRGAKAAALRRVFDEERLIVARQLAHYPFDIVAASQWRRSPNGEAPHLISAAGVLLLLVIGAVVVLCIRQIRSYESLVVARAETDQKSQLDAAINNISLGLLMFHSSERVVVNRRYIEMGCRGRDRPGLAFRDFFSIAKARLFQATLMNIVARFARLLPKSHPQPHGADR